MDVFEAVESVRKRLEEARRQAAMIPELEQQLLGLESFIASTDASPNGAQVLRLPDPPEPQQELEEEDDDWASMTRPSAVLKVLADSPRSLSPSAIADTLGEYGRTNDDAHNVGIALSRLKKRGLVVSKGYGRWAANRRALSETGGGP